QTAYALARRDRPVYAVKLVQRPADARLMPGMWELPGVVANGAEPVLRLRHPLLQLRHSITTTDHEVSVFAVPATKGMWVETARLSELPLTGLARKILRRLL
ncbi:MAG: A/G-specific adenine glycosylase, partial [Acidobacteriota bacterium]|nr:A/G-specific adenine glycosylase [Acidobacteriota bacterium]